MKKVNGLTFIATIVLLLVSQQTLANSITQIGRYTTVMNKPSAAQINPLLTVQQMKFSQSVKTVGDAVKQWLKFSGYELIAESNQSEELKEVLKQTLPQVDRTLGPLAIQEGLKVLVGINVFSLVQDPLHRKVSFNLNEKFKGSLQSNNRKSK